MTDVTEVNFDGLIGPTHNHSGLALGNIASLSHKYLTSSPKQAALQGLAKMKLVHSLGITQGFIPPQERPNIDALKEIGYKGTDDEIVKKVSDDDQNIFLSCCSASSMWCANAATVTPSLDTKDGKVHITTSNLITYPHRAAEIKQTDQFLKEIFDGDSFVIHSPLTGDNEFDEGAANHMRLAAKHSSSAVHVFVYGNIDSTRLFPSRQSREASTHNAKNHKIKENAVFIEQNPDAIERGAFHNDVIATGNANVLCVHQNAFKEAEGAFEQIQSAFKKITKQELILIKIGKDQLSIDEAVQSYLFNSQIVTLLDGQMAMIAPVESKEGRPRAVIDEIISKDNPISEVHFVDLRQSMANGGGPACLRLRVLLTSDELAQIHPGYILDDQKFDLIEEWINAHYLDALTIDELKNPQLLIKSRQAMDELTSKLNLGNIYSFQK